MITNLLVHPELCPALMVVTIQRELAERMCARPATPAYGAVSVVVQALADVSIVRSLPPTVFWPRPKVDSAVVAIRPDAGKRAAVGDVAWFHEVVRRVFLHRRKYLRHVLAEIWRDRWTKTEVDSGSSLTGSAARFAPSRSMSRSSSHWHMRLRERWGELPRAAVGTARGHQPAHEPENECEE